MWGIERDSPSRTTLALCRFWAAASLRRAPTHWSFGQLCSLAGPGNSPASYFRDTRASTDEGYLCSSRWAGGIFHVSYHDVKLSPDDLLAAINRQTGGEGGSGIGGDEAFREIKRPVLVLAGTKDQSDAGDRSRTLLPDCHFMFVYDAGRAIGAERPEALAYIVLGFFERRDLFLVSRESGMASHIPAFASRSYDLVSSR